MNANNLSGRIQAEIRGGAVVSARLPPVWPGFDSRTRRHMWVAFVVGSLLAPRGFSPGTPVFLPPPSPLPHQCGLGSIPGPGVICGLRLLLVLSLLREVFLRTRVFPSPQKPTFPNPNSTWNACTRINELLRALRCYVGKYITIYHFYGNE